MFLALFWWSETARFYMFPHSFETITISHTVPYENLLIANWKLITKKSIFIQNLNVKGISESHVRVEHIQQLEYSLKLYSSNTYVWVSKHKLCDSTTHTAFKSSFYFRPFQTPQFIIFCLGQCTDILVFLCPVTYSLKRLHSSFFSFIDISLLRVWRHYEC